jgi:hypothetical protein
VRRDCAKRGYPQLTGSKPALSVPRVTLTEYQIRYEKDSGHVRYVRNCTYAIFNKDQFFHTARYKLGASVLDGSNSPGKGSVAKLSKVPLVEDNPDLRDLFCFHP